MENPFTLLENRIAGLEDLLYNILARLDELKQPDQVIFGDIADCSAWIKKSKSTIYKMISSRRIPHIKNGNKVLFVKSDIIEWLNTGHNSDLKKNTERLDQHLKKIGNKYKF
jgi:excisionase family DNA binding protein